MKVAATGTSRRLAIDCLAYREWPDSYRLSNSLVEALIVPEIGRIMRFGFVGEPSALWENHSGPDGKWANYGGDKAWPAPQEGWPAVCGRAWPPPTGFDAAPFTTCVEDERLIMSSPIDEDFGIQVTREITLGVDSPVMTVLTRFHKVCGTPANVAVWVVTQFREPERVFANIPEFGGPKRFTTLSPVLPDELRVNGRLLSLRRSHRENTKIISDATSLVWMDAEYVVRIDTEPDAAGALSRTAIYTNKDPLAYVELETEGPVVVLGPGDCVSQTNGYRLLRRSTTDCNEEARRAFLLKTQQAQ